MLPFGAVLSLLHLIEFNIENSTEKFIDLANSFIKFKVQILKHDGTNLGEEDAVVPINYSILSLDKVALSFFVLLLNKYANISDEKTSLIS